MPVIYLSPSTQEYNQYVKGGTEEQYMNLIADAMIPYLYASGINYMRNTPQMTAAGSIRESNSGNYDLHLALHSNAAAGDLAGKLRGIDAYYYPGSVNGYRAAEIFANNLKNIYPDPELVKPVSTTRLGEVRRTKAPSVLLELGYHDNTEDESWIKENISTIAENLVYSITEYFGLPFITPQPERVGRVTISDGYLNLRSRPSIYGNVLTTLDNGDTLIIRGSYNDWYLVQADGILGYVNSAYVTLE